VIGQKLNGSKNN